MARGSLTAQVEAEHRLLERAGELAALRTAVERASGGTPSVTMVLGEAGIGKSRLVRELSVAVQRDGVAVLRGDCVEFDGVELPYGPVAAALRDVPPQVMADAWASLPRQAQREIQRSLPHVAVADEPTDESPATDPFSQGRLYESLFLLLRALTDIAVVLLVVEDFHWVDPSTRDFIVFLARNLRRERMAVVVTYRTDELRPEHPVRRLLGEIRRIPGVDIVELKRLSRSAVAARLEEIVREAPAPELVDAIFERSGGNPFFVEELSATRASTNDVSLPASLADTLLDRYRDLSPPARRVLQFASAIAKPFDPVLMADVSHLPEPQLSAAVRESCEHHLLVDAASLRQPPRRNRGAIGLDGGQARRLAFRHDVVREAIYTDLLAGERAEIHRSIARVLEGTAGQAELAFHWREAGTTSKALEASIEAGLEAERARAFRDALYQFEAARTLASKLEEPPEGLPLDQVELLSHAGDLAKYTGDSARAFRLYGEALSAVDPTADPERAARLLERRGRCESYADDAGLASYQEALSVMPTERRADRARLISEEGFALTMLMRHEEALDRCTDALELALEANAPSEEGYARMMLGVALGFLGDTDEGERQLRAARRLAQGSGRAEDLLRAHLYLAEVLRLKGRISEALAVTEEGEEKARELGMYLAFGRYMALNAAADLFLVGRWDEASDRIEATSGVDLEAWEALLRDQVAGQIALGRGRLDTAEAHLTQARRLYDEGAPAEFAPDVYAPLAELALWRDRPERARELIGKGVAALGDRADPLHSPTLYAMGARVEATAVENQRLRASTDAPRLCRELDLLLETRGRGDPPGAARAHQASAHAEAARAAGEPAEDLWRDAIDAWQRLGAPYPAAYATWRRAQAMLAAGRDRREAARVLGDAYAVAQGLGAEPLTGAIADLARVHRLNLEDVGRPAPVAPSDPAADLGLTPREVEVLMLIVQGLTNRQIASALVISEKTAGVHVSHIFAKLEVHNRAAATAAALQAGLVPPGPPTGATSPRDA
jgi:DNA-binding CsgD family transcriptional regulator/tetratricopeptide (TPR) repeat protein